MIKIALRWYCTLCSYGKDYDPGTESPPKICPACADGEKKADKYIARKK